MKRSIALFVTAATAALIAASGTAPSVVLANSCQAPGLSGSYDYAFQYTGTAAAFYHLPTCPHNGYFGWVGVNGQVVTPSHFPNLGGSSTNHSIGWLGVSFDDTPGPMGSSWAQEGWYAGCLAGQGQQICTSGSVMDYYDEQYDAGNDAYYVFDNGTLSDGSGHIIRIEYSPGDKCWYEYFNYSTLEDSLCSVQGGPIPGSAAMEATSEVWSGNGGTIEMPKTVYGYSSPGTNSTLRIKGAAGWVNWTSSLSTGGTIAWDERNTSPTYTLSVLVADYEIEGYGQCGSQC